MPSLFRTAPACAELTHAERRARHHHADPGHRQARSSLTMFNVKAVPY